MSDLAHVPAPGKGKAGCIHTSLQACTLQIQPGSFLFLLIPELPQQKLKAAQMDRAISVLEKGAEGREQTPRMEDTSGALKTVHCPRSHGGGRGQQSSEAGNKRRVLGAARGSMAAGSSQTFLFLWLLCSLLPRLLLTPRTLALVSAAMRWASSASTSGSVSAFRIVCCNFCSASSSSSCRCRAFSSHCGTGQDGCPAPKLACLSHPQCLLLPPRSLGWWGVFGSKLWYLAVQGLLVGQLAFQLVIEVMDGGGFSLGCQVAFLQRGDPLLHVFFLSQGLGKRWGCHILICHHQFGNNWATQLL